MVNLDSKPINVNRDMLAQGAANIAACLFSGIPAGGSVGRSALNVLVGARTRWSGIFAGLSMLATLLFLATPVGYVPMAVLAALMIFAGIGAIAVAEAGSIWAVGWPTGISAIVTFLASLFLSLTMAILIGVVLSALMSVVRAANDVTVRVSQGRAGAGGRTGAERLPLPAGARRRS